MVRRLKKLLRYWRRGGNKQFTIICTYSRFRAGMEVFHIRGEKETYRIAKKWVDIHPCGAADVFHGFKEYHAD